MLYSNTIQSIQICSTGTKLRLACIREGASAKKIPAITKGEEEGD